MSSNMKSFSIITIMMLAIIAVKTVYCQSNNIEPEDNSMIENIEKSDDQLMIMPSAIMDISEELNIDEPYLWQMAAFAARQMSDKRLKFKLMTLTSAEKFDDSTYRLRVTLKRIKIDEPMAKNDVMYCTVEVIDYQGKWSMDNFGCSLPAMVRTRERFNNKREHSLQSQTSSSLSAPSSMISNAVDSPLTSQQQSSLLIPSPLLTRQQQQQPLSPISTSLIPLLSSSSTSSRQSMLNFIKSRPLDNHIDDYHKHNLNQIQMKNSFFYPTSGAQSLIPQPQPIGYYQSSSTPYSYQEYYPYYKFYY